MTTDTPNPARNIRIVLCRPLYGGNVGSVCRAMMNMGLADLAVVRPGQPLDDSAIRQMSMHAYSIYEQCTQHPDLAEAVAECHVVAGTTGRKGLYFGSHTESFEGLTVEESRPVLQYLTAHASRPEFTGRVRWGVGTLTLWDNRSCQHFAINDYDGFRRCVHKITIQGDAPF